MRRVSVTRHAQHVSSGVDGARHGNGIEAAEPYETVRIRVTFPKLGEQPNTLDLERYVPWEQVYGEDEEEKDAEGVPDGN